MMVVMVMMMMMMMMTVLVAMLIVLFIFVIVILCFIVVALFPMTTVALKWYSICSIYIYICVVHIEYAALFATCLSISMNAVKRWHRGLSNLRDCSPNNFDIVMLCCFWSFITVIKDILYFFCMFFLQYNIPCRLAEPRVHL